MCYVLCIVCYVLCILQNVCISVVLSTFLELCLGLENVLKWELLILHRFYCVFLVSPRGPDESAADLRELKGRRPWPQEGIGGGTLPLRFREQESLGNLHAL